jgi:hypothetical protein
MQESWNAMIRKLSCAAFVAAGLILGCGGDQGSAERATFAAGWSAEETPHFRVYEPPDSPRVGYLRDFGVSCETVYEQLVRFLNVETDRKIQVYRFITSQDCVEATGQPAGFVDKYTIYTRIGAPMGGAIALAACTSIDPDARPATLLRDGLRHAFDSQSNNIHQETSRLRGEGRWIPLADLVGGIPASDAEAYHAETASFIAYLIQRHGIDRFKMVWRSALEPQPTLEEIYGGTLQDLEDDWIAHLEREAKRS